MPYYDAITNQYYEDENPYTTPEMTQAVQGQSPVIEQLGTGADTTATGLREDTNIMGTATPDVMSMQQLPSPSPLDVMPDSLNIPPVQQAAIKSSMDKKTGMKDKKADKVKSKGKLDLSLLGKILMRGGDVIAEQYGRSEPFIAAKDKQKLAKRELDPISEESQAAVRDVSNLGLLDKNMIGKVSKTQLEKYFPFLEKRAAENRARKFQKAQAVKAPDRKPISPKDMTLAYQGMYSVNQLKKRFAAPDKWGRMQKKIAASKLGWGAGLEATREGRAMRSEMRNAVDVILRFRTGARINKDEFDQAMEAWGIQIGDSHRLVNKKLNDLDMMYKLMTGEISPGDPNYQASLNRTDEFVADAKKRGVIKQGMKIDKKADPLGILE